MRCVTPSSHAAPFFDRQAGCSPAVPPVQTSCPCLPRAAAALMSSHTPAAPAALPPLTALPASIPNFAGSPPSPPPGPVTFHPSRHADAPHSRATLVLSPPAPADHPLSLVSISPTPECSTPLARPIKGGGARGNPGGNGDTARVHSLVLYTRAHVPLLNCPVHCCISVPCEALRGGREGALLTVCRTSSKLRSE